MRLDEAAVAVSFVTLPRLGLSLFGAVMAALILGAAQAAGWLAIILTLEVWLWAASRSQVRGGPVRRRARVNFLVSYAAISLGWLALSVMMWSAGTIAGQTSAAVLSLTVAVLVVLLFYSTPLVFLAAGAVPAISALLIVGLSAG